MWTLHYSYLSLSLSLSLSHSISLSFFLSQVLIPPGPKTCCGFDSQASSWIWKIALSQCQPLCACTRALYPLELSDPKSAKLLPSLMVRCVVSHVPKVRGHSFEIHPGRMLASDWILLYLVEFEKSVCNAWPLKIVYLFKRMIVPIVVRFQGIISIWEIIKNYERETKWKYKEIYEHSHYMDTALTGFES